MVTGSLHLGVTLESAALDVVDVVIVGGGPVGLFLGCRLAQLGVDFVVLEARAENTGGSRAIGIHGPSLERFAALGLAEPLCASGVHVTRGRVFSSRRQLGAVDLTRAPGPFSFVLSIPQARTESLLAERLVSLRPGALVGGACVVAVEKKPDGARAWIASRAESRPVSARVIVGCDGRDSVVRREAKIELVGSARPESYLMGDFADTTEYGSDAAIILADGGLVESFPLPGGRRRWVAQAEAPTRNASPEELARLVLARTGHRIDPASAAATTAFGVERRRARSIVSGRLVLAGDAAHVVSPFGGQGMNLGFLDAWDLAESLRAAFAGEMELEPALSGYARRRTRAARRAVRRGQLNGLLGRRRKHPRLRNAAVAGFLATTPEHVLCELFTMRGLE